MTKSALTTNPLDNLLETDCFSKSDTLFTHWIKYYNKAGHDFHDKIQSAIERGTVFLGKFERRNSDYNSICISGNDSNLDKTNKHKNKIKLSDSDDYEHANRRTKRMIDNEWDHYLFSICDQIYKHHSEQSVLHKLVALWRVLLRVLRKHQRNCCKVLMKYYLICIAVVFLLFGIYRLFEIMIDLTDSEEI